MAHEYVHMACSPAQIRQLVDRAIRIAKAERTVTCIIIPNDVQEMEAEPTPAAQARHHPFRHRLRCAPRWCPAEEDLRRAAEVLNAGKKVAMLVGAGALQATDEVIEAAELLGAGVAKALLGKAAVPDDLPYVTGSIGLLGTKPSWDMMMDCDTLLMIGSQLPLFRIPARRKARRAACRSTSRPACSSIRYPMEVNLVGDSAADAARADPAAAAQDGPRLARGHRRRRRDWWERSGSARHGSAPTRSTPSALFWELSPRLPDNCIITCDSGSAANWYARDIKIRRGMMASLSGGLATMGPGVPYAIAAKFAYPDRVAIACVGDGAMQMNGINGLITIAKYWKRMGATRAWSCWCSTTAT